MRVTFYCDVPEYKWANYNLWATEKPCNNPPAGLVRVRFDVDLPDGVLKEYDVRAQPVRAERD